MSDSRICVSFDILAHPRIRFAAIHSVGYEYERIEAPSSSTLVLTMNAEAASESPGAVCGSSTAVAQGGSPLPPEISALPHLNECVDGLNLEPTEEERETREGIVTSVLDSTHALTVLRFRIYTAANNG